jgi:hypothetical protein
MSTLGDAVLRQVVKKGFETATAAEVEAILDDAGILTSATAGVPVRLRVARLHFSGTKQLHPGGVGDATGTPFAFDWDIPDGVSGIGSGANLRGKSSVLNVLQWALTGRCQLQDDVKSWIERVEVEWRIDDARIEVTFDVTDVVPTGEVVLIEDTNRTTRRTALGTFGSEQDFEVLMGKLMMDRLRLDPIAMWSATQETSHRWPAYASALSVQANKLDPLIGNEGVLASRMLQMFAGTSWATPGSQAATASRGLAFEAERAKEKATSATEVTAAARAAAEARVAAARAHVESFSNTDPDVSMMLGLTAEAHDLAQKSHQVELKLNTAKTAAAQVQDQLKAEQVRQNGLMEDALARLFFNSMEPTVCPRCTAAVTEERKKAEPEKHSCSVCSHDLDLSALAGDVVVATSVPADTKASLVEAAANAVSEKAAADVEEGAVIDALLALQNAATKAEEAVALLQTEYDTAVQAREAATEQARASADQIEAAKGRQKAAMDLARAEGVLEGMAEQAPVDVPAGPDPLTVAVVDAAHDLLRKWLKEEQDPRLDEISTEIADLARSFGSDNLDSVTLLGNCSMKVVKGGVSANYGTVTPGEKLRLKLATTIALIKYGYVQGIGRHPGLLFIDSPAAEEIPETNLKTMLQALHTIAADGGIQILVATRHGNVLNEVLPADHAIVAVGNDPVW